MATISEALKGLTAYPIPSSTLETAAAKWGCSLTEEATQDAQRSKAYNLVKADLLMWLSLAPNIAQGGQNYSFTDEQRQQFRKQAQGLYAVFADNDPAAQKTSFGYKGDRL